MTALQAHALAIVTSPAAVLEQLRVKACELAAPIQCERTTLVKHHAHGITDYVMVCLTHGCPGPRRGSLEEAKADICQLALDMRLASARGAALLTLGYEPLDDEAVHG